MNQSTSKKIELNCPICFSKINITDSNMICENNHIFNKQNGVYKLLEPTVAKRLDHFLKQYTQYFSKKEQHINQNNINKLPYVNFNKKMWQLRVKDLETIEGIIKEQQQLTILDIGAWNGWLSTRLASKNNNVVALDYFVNCYDGLESVEKYDHKFTAIQGNLSDLSIFNSKFDLIILNRCFPYLENPKQTLNDLKKLLSKKGTIIITGINISNDPTSMKKSFEEQNKIFKKKYNIPLGFTPFKAYIDSSDIDMIKEMGFTLNKYKFSILKSIYNKFKKTKIDFYYAVFKLS